ncbi:hypothetical protein TEA_011502 [Camellia sinensis var. sinensis]|uniref:Uncharacterized protein n=1 Tax=Camellia sinensis var. sinensis TaxID=542762 RepID=A0A4S4EW12_CAMSN|nr:hypothetical protein TEA_011502 [Camellia sinensis var. sinensis]
MESQSAPQPSITDCTIQDNMPLYVPVFEDKNMDQSPLHPLSVEIPNSMSWMIPETPQAWNHLSFTHLLQVKKWDLSLASVWNTVVWLMLMNFAMKIVTETAQSFLKELQEKELASLTKSAPTSTSTICNTSQALGQLNVSLSFCFLFCCAI